MGTDNIHSRKHLETFRKELRNGATPAEKFLWKHIKSKQLAGRRFVRQHSILNFIVDFYCASEMLIIELDGQGHFTKEGMQYDKQRSAKLEGLGYKVIRFENKYVFEHPESVLLTLHENFKTSSA
jgi:very-short-patch-repair endonuclease